MDLNRLAELAYLELRRKRVTTLIVGSAMALVLGACTYEGPAPNQSVPARQVWGPDARYYTNQGIPYVGESRWPSPARVASFTETKTGVVYVDADTSKIVWEGWEHDTKEIGQQPWREPNASKVGLVWGEFRDIVGNPSRDVVSWVETTDGHRGDIVAVQQSTGEVLARAPILASPRSTVVLASVDDATVYYATVEDICVWRWAAGEDPRPSQRGTAAVADVSGDTWAVGAQDRIDFESTDGSLLSSVHASYGDRTYFGGGLSPDGRFWFAPAHELIVETTTGKEIRLDRGFTGRYGWTGPEELTLIGPGLSVCSAVTGDCEEPINASYTPSEFGLPLN